MDTKFQTLTFDNIFDDEPEFILHEKESIKTTQVMTKEEAEKIAEGNLGLVYNLANKFAYGRNDHDEIVGVAYMGYVKAINGFDARKGVKFVTFAFRCITNEILFYIRNEHKETEKLVPMNLLISTDKNGNELELEDVLSDDEQNIEEEFAMQDTLRIMMSVIDTYLTPEEQKIIKERFGIQCIQKTQSQIAEELDMSQANISKKEKNIIQKIKIIMTSKYGEDIGNI